MSLINDDNTWPNKVMRSANKKEGYLASTHVSRKANKSSQNSLESSNKRGKNEKKEVSTRRSRQKTVNISSPRYRSSSSGHSSKGRNSQRYEENASPQKSKSPAKNSAKSLPKRKLKSTKKDTSTSPSPSRKKSSIKKSRRASTSNERRKQISDAIESVIERYSSEYNASNAESNKSQISKSLSHSPTKSSKAKSSPKTLKIENLKSPKQDDKPKNEGKHTPKIEKVSPSKSEKISPKTEIKREKSPLSKDGSIQSNEVPIKRKRGRPKGSKNKIKSEDSLIEAEKHFISDFDSDENKPNAKKLKMSKSSPKKNPVGQQKKLPKKKSPTKDTITKKSKVEIANKKTGKSSPTKVIHKPGSELYKKAANKQKTKTPVSKVKSKELPEDKKQSSPRAKSPSHPPVPAHKDQKYKSMLPIKKKYKREYLSESDTISDKDDKTPIIKNPKKDLRDKWKKELKQKHSEGQRQNEASNSTPDRTKKEKPRAVTFNLKDYEFTETDETEKDTDSEVELVSKSYRKRATKIKKSTSQVPPVRRTARMASLNARAMMHCMNEDAKVPLPSHSNEDSLAIVPIESTIARTRSDSDTDEDSDSEIERIAKSHRRLHKNIKMTRNPKKRRKKRNELGVTMDISQMVVKKRMASLNASAIMAAQCYSMDSRSRRMPTSNSSENDATDIDIKRKISYKSSKKQRTRSVITVEETTKKVKKAQGRRETEVEEKIIFKKKIKRRSGIESTDTEKDDNVSDTSEIENELPKSHDMMIESSITYVTTQTLAVPKSVPGSNMYYVSSTSTSTKNSTIQHIEKTSVDSTSVESPHPPASSSNSITHEDEKSATSQSVCISRKYSPLGALSEMHPVMQHPQVQPPQQPPPPPPPHGMPFVSQHHMFPPQSHSAHPPYPLPNPPVHAPLPPIIPHSSPYPPLSPHSPPYPPPSMSSSSPTASSTPSPKGQRASPYPERPSATSSPISKNTCAGQSPSLKSSPDDRGPPMKSSTLHNDRYHSSAFTAPSSSSHPPSTVSHGYQPVSGPMPVGGSSSGQNYKIAHDSPIPPQFGSPPKIMAPPKPYKHDTYPDSSSHPHQYHGHPSYPYDKYLRPYPIYSPHYPGGQYQQGEYGYPHPHYSQEYSYTFCVPGAPSHHPLALPPPPPPPPPLPPPLQHPSGTSAPPAHPSNAPPYYHCSEFSPVFTYPSPGPSMQNAVCCPPNSKNLHSGPLPLSGKGSENDSKPAWPAPPPPRYNYQYYGSSSSHHMPYPISYQNNSTNKISHEKTITSSIRNTYGPQIKEKETPKNEENSVERKSYINNPSQISLVNCKPENLSMEKNTVPNVPSKEDQCGSPSSQNLSKVNDKSPEVENSKEEQSKNEDQSVQNLSEKNDKLEDIPEIPIPAQNPEMPECSKECTSLSDSIVTSRANSSDSFPTSMTNYPIVASTEVPNSPDCLTGITGQVSKKQDCDQSKNDLNQEHAQDQRIGRHLLCQSLPLSLRKATSVLAKVKPNNSRIVKTVTEKSLDATFSPNFSDVGPKNFEARSSEVLPVIDKNYKLGPIGSTKEGRNNNKLPKKRGRPPKNRNIEDPCKNEACGTVKQISEECDSKSSPIKQEVSDTVKVESCEKSDHTAKDSFESGEEIKHESDTQSMKIFLEEKPKDGKLMMAKDEDINSNKTTKNIENKEQTKNDIIKLLKPIKIIKFKSGKVGRHKKNICLIRRKASLLSYLKEKNIESDTSFEMDSNGNRQDDGVKKKKKESKKHKIVPFPPTQDQLPRKRRNSSGSQKPKICKKPRYIHGWSWEGEGYDGYVWLRNDEILVPRRCFKAMQHQEGDRIKVRDCVLLRSGTRKSDLPYVAKIAALWEDPETSDMMMSILWYYRPEHTEFGRREEDYADEIFASKHRDHLSVACIEDRCYVLTYNEYCRYRRKLRLFQEKVSPTTSPVPESDEEYCRIMRQPNGCVVPDLLFFCRRVYDYRQKRLLKNPL